jgi:WD40 repeat protein
MPDKLSVVDIITGNETILPILDDYLGPVASLDAEHGLVVFQDEFLYVFDLNNERSPLQLSAGDGKFSISPDGSMLIAWDHAQTSQDDAVITVYPLRDEAATSIPLEGVFDYSRLLPIIASPDSQYILATETTFTNTNEFTNHSILYDSQTGVAAAEWSHETPFVNARTLFSPDSHYVITAGENPFDTSYFVDIWDVSTLRTQAVQSPVASLTLDASNSPMLLDLSFSRDGSKLVISLDDALLGDGMPSHGYWVAIFDWADLLARGGELNARDLNYVSLNNVYLPAFSPDDTLIITSEINYNSSGGTNLNLWDAVATDDEILMLEGYSSGVFSPNGDLLAALSRDGRMALWDVAMLLQGDQTPIVTIESPNVRRIAFSPNGDRIYQQTTYGVVTLGVRPH